MWDWRLAGVFLPHELAFMKKGILRGWKGDWDKGMADSKAPASHPHHSAAFLQQGENYPEAKEAIPITRQCCSVLRAEIEDSVEKSSSGRRSLVGGIHWQPGDLQLWEEDACLETASQWWAPAAVAVSWCCPQVALQTTHMFKGPEATNQIIPAINQIRWVATVHADGMGDEPIKCVATGAIT